MSEKVPADKIAALYALLIKLDEPGKALESISHEEFITIWETSADLASAVGFMSVVAGKVLKPAKVRSRAAQYRKLGIALKPL